MAADVLTELDELVAAVEDVRDRAAALAERRARLPGEREAARTERERLEAEARSRRDALRDVEAELAAAEAARAEARLAEARRAEVRARDLLRSAERRAEAAGSAEEALEREDAELARSTEALIAQARQLAVAFAERPGVGEAAGRPPEADLGAVAAWATEARAGLLVARAGLAAERDAVIRQANELGGLILGEPLAAQSAALVARRVEERLSDEPSR